MLKCAFYIEKYGTTIPLTFPKFMFYLYFPSKTPIIAPIHLLVSNLARFQLPKQDYIFLSELLILIELC